MLKVGLTGNLGSGKTTVAGIFRTLGIPVHHADEVSKGFLSHKDVKATIISCLGPSILSSSGEIDRRSLGNLVFSDEGSLAKLNAILHPLVMDDIRNWCSLHSEKDYVILEAAIIFESGFQEEYDRIIHVSCPEDTAIARAMERDHVSRDEVLNRMKFQWCDEEKTKLADYVIINDGSEMVLPQVLRLNEVLTACR